MSDNEKPIPIGGNTLDELLDSAIDLTDGNATYVTNMRFRMTINDITIDMYRVSPDPANPQQNVAYLLHRVIVPPGLAKITANILSNMTAQWEETFGVSLPIAPADVRVEVEEDEV